MHLRQRRAECARRRSGDGGRLAVPRVLAVGARTPVYRVLEQSGNGTVVLRRHEQQAVGGGDLRLEAHHAARELAFEVLIVERQIADRDEIELRLVGAEPRKRVRELAVDGFAAIAADDDGDLDLGLAGLPWLWFDTKAT